MEDLLLRPDIPFPAIPNEVECKLRVIRNGQGLQLQTYTFAPKHVSWRGVAVLIHGASGHTVYEWFLPKERGQTRDQWHGSVCEALVAEGLVVLAVDRQGHGRSQGHHGLRNYYEKFSYLCDEIEALIKQVIHMDDDLRDLPFFLFGQSLGGAVAVQMARRAAAAGDHSKYAGMVLYSPMLSLERMRQQPFLRCCGTTCLRTKHIEPLGTLFSCMCPAWQVVKTASFPEDMPFMEAERQADPFTYKGRARARVAKVCADVSKQFLAGGLAEVRTPFIAFQANRDQFVDPHGAEALLAQAKFVRPEDKSLVTVGPGEAMDVNMFHLLSVEPGHETVVQAAVEWISGRCGLMAGAVTGNQSPAQHEMPPKQVEMAEPLPSLPGIPSDLP
mmetsp:Transcript_38828/g.91333  ORF Transcript_38828/g.91333 Transcript_38828/m.91333 type:complete len:387 (+) Transcript_38828:79-1239(+)